MRCLTICLTILLLSACTSNGKEEENSGDTKPVEVLPNTESSTLGPNGSDAQELITTPKISDTLRVSDPFKKDSIRMHIAFQKAADEMADALFKRSALAFSMFTPQSVILKYKTRSDYVLALDKVFKEDQDSIIKIVAGPMKRIAIAEHDGYAEGWYCLIRVIKYAIHEGDVIRDVQWFGGQTLDEGKHCYFLNITGVTRENILQLMPDLHFVLDKEVLN